MTAYKLSERDQRAEAGNGKTPLVTIHHGDRLNNDDRAPYWDGNSAARALLIHAAGQLADPDNGKAYFERLRQTYENNTVTAQSLRKMFNARSEASAAALERSDLAIDSERELNLINAIAQSHKEIAAKLMPELQANGQPAELILPTVDHLTRRALRSATSARTGTALMGPRPNQLGDAAENLVVRLGRIEGIDHGDDRAVVDQMVAAARSGEGIDEARAALVAKLGNENIVADRVIPEGMTAAEVDALGIANRFSRLAVSDRERAANEDQINPNAWQNDLLARMEAASPGNSQENTDIVVRFAHHINELEQLLPSRVARSEQLYDIDESIDPTEFARARDRISGSLSASLSPADADEIDALAAGSVYRAMSAEERYEAATTVPLSPAERIELGMHVIGSTPPIIELPAIDLGKARFDVAMATTEEAVVMESLINWAGETRAFPGHEAARDQIMGLLRDTSNSAVLGVETLGIAVANDPALIAHAKSTIAAHTAEHPDDRILIFADVPSVGEELMQFRAEELAKQGKGHAFADGADATREFGGWTLPGNQDRLLGQGKFDTDIFVAASDNVMTLSVPSQLDALGVGKAEQLLASAEANVRKTLAESKAAHEALVASYDPKLVAAVKGFEDREDTENPDYTAALNAMLQSGKPALMVAADRQADMVLPAQVNAARAAEKLAEIERQNASEIYSRASRGEVLMAEIVDSARRRDKLFLAYTTLSSVEIAIENKKVKDAETKAAETGDVAKVRTTAKISTPFGPIVEKNVYQAQTEASKLLGGRPYEERRLREALDANLDSPYASRNINTVAVLGSNFFNRKTKMITDNQTGEQRRISASAAKLDEKGKKIWKDGKPVMEPILDDRGIDELIERARSMSKSTVFVIEDRKPDSKIDNPVTEAMYKLAAETQRDVIHAVAWRVTDNSSVISNGRRMYTSDRKTEVDFGVIAASKGKNGTTPGRSRAFNPQDMRRKVLAFQGGGQMTRDTWDAIREYRAAQGVAAEPLTPVVAYKIAEHLITAGARRVELPTIPRWQQADAVRQEAMAMIAKSGLIGSDFGKDFVSANHVMNFDRLGKLSAVIGQDGQVVSLDKAREHAKPMAPSIADITHNALRENGVLEVRPLKDDGQLILNSFKGISPEKALALGNAYERMGDIMEAAEKGQLAVRLSSDVVHQLSRPKAWQEADDRANMVIDSAHNAKMTGFTAAAAEYPINVLAAHKAANEERAARIAGTSEKTTPIPHVSIAPIFTKGNVDLNKATTALVIGGNARVNDDDIAAAKRIAAEAAKTETAVSIHLGGDAAAQVAVALAEMPAGERPRLLLIGDGHPEAHTSVAQREAVQVVTALENGGFATATPPVLRTDRDDAYVADARAAMDFQAMQADAVVVVKSSGNDIEMLGLRTAISADKPIAVVGPVTSEESPISDIRFRMQEYSANRRLLDGGNSVSVMLDTRVLAFVAKSTPDMSNDTAPRYVMFEGSTAGKTRTDERNRDADHDPQRGAIQSGERIQTRIDWAQAAVSIEDGRGYSAFMEKVSQNEVASIAATPAQIAAADLAKDAKFLDQNSRAPISAEVQQVFSEIQNESSDMALAEMQLLMRQQQAGAGR
jgi:hypothetical protein